MQLGGAIEVTGRHCWVAEGDIAPSGLQWAAALVGQRAAIESV
jgi:hypothetical protein